MRSEKKSHFMLRVENKITQQVDFEYLSGLICLQLERFSFGTIFSVNYGSVGIEDLK